MAYMIKKSLDVRRTVKQAVSILAFAVLICGASGFGDPAQAGSNPAPVKRARSVGQTAQISSTANHANWFRYGSHVVEAWTIREDVSDPYHLTIHRRSINPDKPKRRVFVLYPRPSSAYDVAITKILDVFDEKDINAEFTVVNFRNSPKWGNAAISEAEAGDFEMVFTMGSQSTAWMDKNYHTRRIPVVSVCSKDPVVLGQTAAYEKGSGKNFAFTSLNMPIDAQMAYVLELKPKLRNIGVLVNSKNVSAVKTQAEPIARFARRRGIRVLYLAVEHPKEARAELAKLVHAAVASMRKNDPSLDNSVFWVTGSTAVFREIAEINANSDRVPVLSAVPDVVGEGDDSAVLSVGIGFESNAHLAAVYGAEILAGRAEAGKLPVGVVSPPDIAINFRKAREIGLKVPFRFFESASFVYDYEGNTVRYNGKRVAVDRSLIR